MIDEIEQQLKRNQTRFGDVLVTIDTGGIGGRYRAFLESPSYNTMVQTPDLVDREGLLSFYSRLAPKIVEVINNQ